MDFHRERGRLQQLLLLRDVHGLTRFFESLPFCPHGHPSLETCLPDGWGIVGDCVGMIVCLEERDPQVVRMLEAVLVAGFSPYRRGGDQGVHAGGRLLEAVDQTAVPVKHTEVVWVCADLLLQHGLSLDAPLSPEDPRSWAEALAASNVMVDWVASARALDALRVSTPPASLADPLVRRRL